MTSSGTSSSESKSLSSEVCQSASRAITWPSERATEASLSGRTTPFSTIEAIVCSASTSRSPKTTSSSVVLAKPSERQSRSARSSGTPARSATSVRV